MSQLSERIRAIEPSATMAVATKARELKAAGRDVISLTAGEPDHPTPAVIIEAAYEAMKAGRTRYTGAGGLPALTKALVDVLAAEGVNLEGPGAVLPTPGAKQAIYYAIHALVNPGDGVLVPEPAWVSYKQIIGLAGGRHISVPLDPERGFRLEAAPLKAAAEAAGGAKVLLLNSPGNPTGRVLDGDELDAVAEVARDLDLTVISDEIYGPLTYAPAKFVRLASIPELADRVVTVDGFSKAYAMTGWRLGWVAGPSHLVAGMRKLQSHSATCPAEFTQVAGVTALRECAADVERFRESYRVRGEIVAEIFGAIDGVRVSPIEGAFYGFLDCRELMGGDDQALANRWLDECDVAMVPGSAFGDAGRGFLRMSFAASEAELRGAAGRLQKAGIR